MKSKELKKRKIIMILVSLIVLCVIATAITIGLTYNKVNSFFTAEGYSSADSTTVKGTFQLNTSVNASAANGKGGTNLSWNSVGENVVYKAYQKKDGANEWTPISMMDFYEKMDTVKVLNVYPHKRSDIDTVTFTYLDGTTKTLPKSAALKVWMEGGTMNENGTITTFDAYGKNPYTGQQLLYVTPVTSTEFNNNPSMIWNYDVVMFGTWDTNGAYEDQPNQEALNVIESYIQSGYGVLCGHDTIGYNWNDWGLSKLRKYFNIEVGKWGSDYRTATGIDYQDSWGYLSTKVIVDKQGLLTNFPWELPLGATLTIPAAHTCANAAKGETWMDFDKNQGSYFNGGGTDSSTNYYSYGKGDAYYYLTTYNNTAMIQTGHSNCNSTEDERKVLANTLFYLKQLTSTTSITDNSSQDLAAPNVPIAKFIRKEQKYISFSATDNGTPYSFYVEAYNKSDYKNVISTSNISTESVATGIRGYYYVIDNNEVNDFAIENAQFTTEKVEIDNSYIGKYVHVRAIDNAGNIGPVGHQQIEGQVTLDKTAKWVDAQNAIAEITLDVNVKEDEQNKPLDVIIVQDVSGSMSGSRMTLSKGALTDFSNKLYEAAPDSRIALVSFESSGHIVCGFTNANNKSSLISGINSLRASGGTDYSAGLQKAIDLINNSGNKKRDTYILFVSDGEPNSNGSGSAEARKLKAMGNVTTYGIGIQISSGTQIKNICGNENYYSINSDSDYQKVYTNIFKDIVSYTNENITCVDTISKYFKVADGQNLGSNVTVNNNEVVWNIGSMRSGNNSLKIKVQLKDEYRYSEKDINAWYETNDKAELTYMEHELMTDYKEWHKITTKTPILNYIYTPEIINIKVEGNNASHGIEYFGLFTDENSTKTNIIRSINYAEANNTTFSVLPRDNYYLYMVDSEGNKLTDSHLWYYEVTSLEGNIIQVKNGFRITNTPICTITQSSPKQPNVTNDILTVKNSKNSINLKRIWLTIAGNVWNDKNKDGRNGGSTDEAMENIIVVLHSQTESGDKTLSTKTDNKGDYKFEQVDIAYPNYVEFKYNGAYYMPTIYKASGVNWNNSSKVVENINDRRNFNNKFGIITNKTNSYTRNELVSKGVIDRFGNVMQNNYHDETGYANECIISAYTGHNQNDIFYQDLYVTENTRADLGFNNYDFTQYINLGLIDRQEADIAITEDIFSVTATINGKREDYSYNNKWSYKTTSIYEIDERVSRGYYTNNYTREIYKSDYDYTGQNPLDIYVTYQLAVKNQSDEIAIVANEIVNYYDEDYSFYDIYLGYDNGNRVNVDNLFEVGETSKYSETKNIPGYKNLYIRNEENKIKITAGGECYIYVTFKVNRDEHLKIEHAKASVVELNAYSTYYYVDNAPNKNNPNTQKDYEVGEIAGIIDIDSVPGNVNTSKISTTNKETMLSGKSSNELKNEYKMEDDTDFAPSLKIAYEFQGQILERKVQGTVWEENRDKTVDYSQIGNGTLDENENKIEGVTVELVKVSNNEVVNSCKSDENGAYVINGFIPDEYYVRFVYGKDGGKYNGQDYKSTIYHQDGFDIQNPDTNNRYNLKEANDTTLRESDARDLNGDTGIIGTRQYVNNYCNNQGNGVTNKLATMLSEEASEEFKNNVYMTAKSGLIDIQVEYDRTESKTSTIGSNNIGNGNYDLSGFYKLENLDFGLVERPKSQLELTVELANVKVILSNGQILFDASGQATNVMWIAKDKNTSYYEGNFMKIPTVRTYNNGQIVVTMDKEIMHGATVQLTYKFAIKNIGEVDYYDTKFYYLGVEDRPYTSSTVNIADTNIVTTSANTVISYVGTQLTDDGNATRNNLQFMKDSNEEWDVISMDEIMRENLIDERNWEDAKKYATIIKTDKLNPKLIPILVNEEKGTTTSKVMLVETITPQTSDDDRTYNCMAEIIKTNNDVGRKMAYSVVGNQSPVKQPQEVDSDSAENMVILPPFGQNTMYYVLGTIVGIILIIGVVGVILVIKRK